MVCECWITFFHTPCTMKFIILYKRNYKLKIPMGALALSSSLNYNHGIANTSKFTQKCNVIPYFYAVCLLRPAISAISFTRKCNWLAGITVTRSVMRRAWRHKLQSSGPTAYIPYTVITTPKPDVFFTPCIQSLSFVIVRSITQNFHRRT